MSALYIGELKSILSQFNESWNEGFSRKHWSILNGAYDCAYELHYYDDKYNDQFLLTCIMDRFDTPKRAQYEIGFNKAFNDSQINQILDTLNEYLGHNFTCSLRENNESSTVQPQTKEELAEIIRQTCEVQGWDCDLNFIDTSKITDMSYLFAGDENYGFGLSDFNGNISNWDTSNVTDMSGMFCDAKYFNGTLNYWDTSNVTNMESMFECAKSFNQPLDNWNTSNVTDMSYMFCSAHSFNQPLDKWNTKNVKNMASMFKVAESFNQPLDNWNVSNVIYMSKMFYGADSFNQNINNWDVSNVTDMEGMFSYTTSFNQPLNNWDISNVTDMEAMFLCAEHFSQDLSQWKINDNCFIDMMFDNTYSLPDAYLPFDLQLDLKTNLINSDHLSSDNNIFIEAPKNDPLLKNTKAIYLQTDRIWIFPINELNSNNTFVLDKNCYKTYDDVLSCSPMLKADICQLFIKNQKNEFTQEYQDKIQDKSEKRSFSRI